MLYQYDAQTEIIKLIDLDHILALPFDLFVTNSEVGIPHLHKKLQQILPEDDFNILRYSPIDSFIYLKHEDGNFNRHRLYVTIDLIQLLESIRPEYNSFNVGFIKFRSAEQLLLVKTILDI